MLRDSRALYCSSRGWLDRRQWTDGQWSPTGAVALYQEVFLQRDLKRRAATEAVVVPTESCARCSARGDRLRSSASSDGTTTEIKHVRRPNGTEPNRRIIASLVRFQFWSCFRRTFAAAYFKYKNSFFVSQQHSAYRDKMRFLVQ